MHLSVKYYMSNIFILFQKIKIVVHFQNYIFDWTKYSDLIFCYKFAL